MIKRFYTISLVAACLLLAAIGCKKDNTSNTVLTIAQQIYTVEAAQTNIDIEIKANIDFTIHIAEDGASWIEHSKTTNKGNDTKTASFNIAANQSEDGRNTTIRFVSSDGRIEHSVAISQKPTEKFVVDNDTYTVDYTAQNLSIELQSNFDIEVKISCDGDWITLTESRALESRTLVFDITENNSTKARKATIEVGGKSEQKMLTVNQTGFPRRMQLSLSHSQATLSSPIWYGANITGNITWGDGTEEAWSEDAEHSFADSSPKESNFTMENALSFIIPQLGTITSIEIVHNIN